ncbi:hypothetical protein VTJ49DRAFT_1842 [Mycothermus thermophilus]|uniref:3-beta hydroxysteroid dehydrogenase/isomerase domain-containing protein n=1 Tax=Humicola insolens TaxID=85995 RepID=A0ABR3VDD6_HUMIN
MAMYLIVAVALLVLYLFRANSALKTVPDLVRKASPHRWTKEEVQETYERVKKEPFDFTRLLPRRLDRRYVVVGGSGLVGGDIVLQLLQRGQPAKSIRIVDFAPVTRRDMLDKAAGCEYVKADISSRASVEAAFSKPWPKSVADKPLTVFHTAALVRPQERNPLFYHRVSPVNRDGAINVLEVARAAGADVFVATSSASVGVVPSPLWTWPWQSEPKLYAQIITEKDFDAPLRPHHQFFSTYALSKAEAERAICAANSPSFRTGVIRPGNPIYGQKSDPIVGANLRMRNSYTWISHVVQNCVNSRNVALAHLQFEAALLSSSSDTLPRCAGRPFVVTDPGPPVTYGDVYGALEQLAVTPYRCIQVQPVPLLLIAHAIEAWCIFVARLPAGVRRALPFLREPKGELHLLQPPVFTVSTHAIVDDSAARKSVTEGGIGYTPGCTTLEGVCEELFEWNLEYEGKEVEEGEVWKTEHRAENGHAK